MDRPLWWQTGVIYQIYPRSFADGNGDGIGDLQGIIGRLDYLTGLGVDAIWLSPIFPSPMADFGYDICDYTGVDPVFGTLDDFDELLSKAHARGLRLILDLVPNHTSDEHPWFVESRSSRSNPKRDWYLWHDSVPGLPVPSNWVSYFGGPAWEWDEATGQFYLHLFHRKQPDLNWRNPEVRAAVYDVMRFWLDRGVDGFRIDVLWLLIKDADFADNPAPPPPAEGEYERAAYHRPGFEDRPEVHEIVREMRALTDEYGERVLIGEIYLPVERLVRYYGPDLTGIHLPFNFSLVTMPRWQALSVRRIVSAYDSALPAGAWPNWVLGNHDVPRIATRAGAAGSRVAQMLLLSLRGTPTCYYGDEIGMDDAVIPAERSVDPQAGAGLPRDQARTPMQWDAGPHAGFTTPDASPWLPVQPSFPGCNVAIQERDARSHLSLFRRLIELRNAHSSLAVGSQALVETPDDQVMAYLRQHHDQRVLVALNFGGSPIRLDLSRVAAHGQALCSTRMDRDGRMDLSALELRPHEGLMLSCGAG